MTGKKGKARATVWKGIPTECCLTCRYHVLAQMVHYCNHFDCEINDSETLLVNRMGDGQLCWRPPTALIRKLEGDKDA